MAAWVLWSTSVAVCAHVITGLFELLISEFQFVIFVIPLLFRLLGIFWKCARIGKPMTAPYSFGFFYFVILFFIHAYRNVNDKA